MLKDNESHPLQNPPIEENRLLGEESPNKEFVFGEENEGLQQIDRPSGLIGDQPF